MCTPYSVEDSNRPRMAVPQHWLLRVIYSVHGHFFFLSQHPSPSLPIVHPPCPSSILALRQSPSWFRSGSVLRPTLFGYWINKWRVTPLFYFYALIGPAAALKPWFLASAAPCGASFFSLKHVDQVTCIASSESAVLTQAVGSLGPPPARRLSQRTAPADGKKHRSPREYIRTRINHITCDYTGYNSSLIPQPSSGYLLAG